ncbi:MAG: ADP-glyceromanno-heptose 6-epimerase [Bacteroidales bacterium]|nr:ADP-glyceromanno-heptose 6-epimerase [Bacteroidales bacterium]MDD4217586.1 ADP-glyceromanno-heptose 6-epimerase [Bacteroidales bacterium]MDY0142367.1 ADP-glyceromanno-heptose 6-epimerase [Bacteroidales bacterium]
MIVITGAAGFIGSNMLAELLERSYTDLILVDDFSKLEKKQNYIDKNVKELVDRNIFGKWLDENHKFVQIIFHLGARTDTAEFDIEILYKLNTEYSKMVWRKCCEYGLPLIYASSAATYGMGELGFSDTENPENLKPLNPYGVSKNDFDKWVLTQEKKPFFWVGLKFFNVYGPNEYHKARMASVIYHAFNQISKTGKLKLFKSHNPDYLDGEQKRDFIYVKDVCDIMAYFMLNRSKSGMYNVGTGVAATFNQLAESVFAALGKEPNIEFVDTPEDIRDKYQYYTCADITKIRAAGYDKQFSNISDGADDYVKNYLIDNKIR